MPFPTIQQYRNVLGLPQGSRPFRSPELDNINQGDVVSTGNPIYLHWGSGSFAVVFRCREQSGKEVALRCLLAPPPQDVAERYNALASYLQGLAERIPYLVEAKYFEDAVKVQGDWFPLFLMDWVDGKTLGSHVADLARNQDVPGLQLLSDKWRQLALTLQNSEIAHGDLQHSNVMVTSTGELRLVDYDTIYVPALIGRSNTATGTPGYVHPIYIQHGGRPYDAHMDTFSALVILLSLEALAYDPTLYGKYSHDNLLFAEGDLCDPSGSHAFQDLVATGEPLITFLTQRLQQLCRNAQDSQVSLPTLLEDAPQRSLYSTRPLPASAQLDHASTYQHTLDNAVADIANDSGKDSIFSDTWQDSNAARRVSLQLFAIAVCVAVITIAIVLIIGNQLNG